MNNANASILALQLSTGYGLIPIGGIVAVAFGSGSVITNFLLCNGAIYLNTAYPALAALLGTTYGGDASHFGVPDLRGRSLFWIR